MNKTEEFTPPCCCPVIIPLKETVLGLSIKIGARDSPMPLSEIGVFAEKPAAAVVVLTKTSLDSGPTCLGANVAWKLMFWPACTV